jgi:hypothetical protein
MTGGPGDWYNTSVLAKERVADSELHTAKVMESFHLEPCTPGQDRAYWYIPVRTGTYRYVPIPASTRFP